MGMSSSQRRSFAIFFFVLVLTVALTLIIYFALQPSSIKVQQKKFPNCAQIQNSPNKLDNAKKIGNNICDRTIADELTYGLNTLECGYDDKDCNDFNTRYINCGPNGEHPSLLPDLGKGSCKIKYNNPECGYDIGLCSDFNKNYPNCPSVNPGLIKNGRCDFDGIENTESCEWDGGDCLIAGLPRCTGIDSSWYNDNKCQRELLRKECNFDGNDCVEFVKKYPNCDAKNPENVGDGKCDLDANTAECGFDGGDCSP